MRKIILVTTADQSNVPNLSILFASRRLKAHSNLDLGALDRGVYLAQLTLVLSNLFRTFSF